MRSSRNNYDEDDDDGVEAVVSFMDKDAPSVNPIFGGSSTYNRQVGRHMPFQPYLDLQQDLSMFIPRALGPRFQIDWQHADKAKWGTLSENIMKSQEDYEVSKSGFWHEVWYGMGGAKDAIDPWVQLIPSDYGLAVVKTGVAVLLKLAENSRKKKERICNTFLGLRKILKESDPSRAGFRYNPEVEKYADALYQAVVDSIRDMIQVTTKQEKGIEMPRIFARFRKEYKHRPPPPDPEKILQHVMDHAGEFQRALTIARDERLERVDNNVQGLALGVSLVYSVSKGAKQDIETIISGMGEVDGKLGTVQDAVTSVERTVSGYSRTLEYVRQESKEAREEERRAREEDRQARAEDRLAREESDANFQKYLQDRAEQDRREKMDIAERERWMQDQISSKDNMLSILIEQQKRDKRVIAELRARNTPQAVVRLDQFCAILADRHSTDEFSKQPNKELSRVLVQRSRLKPQAQAQVQSVMRHDRFVSWLNGGQPGLILVNANLPGGTGAAKVSAVSVFSATLVASLVTAQPDAVVVQFFCGLHASPTDTEFGPNGLLRSIMMQLVLKLAAQNSLSLDFVDELEYLDELRSADQMTRCQALCQALYEFVSQFPAGTKIYCILDSITWLDRETTFPMLEIVMECLQAIVDEPHTAPIFKVFLTNAGHASLRMQNLRVFQEQPSRLISLSSSNLMPVELSPRTVGKHILRPSTPTPGRFRRDMPRLASWGGHYEDEHDDGFETE